MRLIFPRGLATSLFLLVMLSALGADPAASPKPSDAPKPPPPPLAGASLAPALKAAADRDGVKLFTIDASGPEPHDGDATVAWVGATDGKVSRQWLVQFRRSTATPREQASARKPDQTKYLSWGSVITFKSDVQAIDLWIAGPVVVTPAADPAAAVPIKRRRMFVPADYLRLGLDNSLRVDAHIRRRITELRKEDPAFNPGHLYSLEKPIKPENVAYAKPVAEKIGFTAEMERAWCGGYVALQVFYDLINDVPELETIASVAVDRPSVWKLAKLATGTYFKTFIGGPATQSVDPARMGLIPVGTESFDAPYGFHFGKDPIVSGRMVVTAPLPPFDTTAGLLALLATHPKDPLRMVHVVIVSALRGAAPNAANPSAAATSSTR